MRIRLWPTKRVLHICTYADSTPRSAFLDHFLADRIPPKEGDTLNIPEIPSLASQVMENYKPSPILKRDPYEGVDVVIKTVVDLDKDGDPAALTVTHDKRTGQTDISGGKLDE
jgi:hypothetical protein